MTYAYLMALQGYNVKCYSALVKKQPQGGTQRVAEAL